MDLALGGPPEAGTRVLVVNAGSSSLKVSLLEGDQLIVGRTVAADRATEDVLLAELVHDQAPIHAVGHRIVHGGTAFTGPVLVDEHVLRELRALVDLAPLHQPKSLEGLDRVGRLLPGVPTVACFDTAFHARIPPAAATYALPREWRARWSLRRFGFHGLSHAYAARRAAEVVGLPLASLRIVTCHLGAGASLCAVAGGVSVDTTMGFTPLEGLVMATRSGSVDPGLVLWLEEHVGMAPSELASALEERAGLLGLAGTGDMVEVLAAEADGDADAGLALAVYLHRLRAAVAAMAAAMGGIEVLVFTGGVGEASARIRASAAAGLAFLGVVLDEAANELDGGDREIGEAGAPVRSLVIQAREDLEIAREVRRLLAW